MQGWLSRMVIKDLHSNQPTVATKGIQMDEKEFEDDLLKIEEAAAGPIGLASDRLRNTQGGHKWPTGLVTVLVLTALGIGKLITCMRASPVVPFVTSGPSYSNQVSKGYGNIKETGWMEFGGGLDPYADFTWNISDFWNRAERGQMKIPLSSEHFGSGYGRFFMTITVPVLKYNIPMKVDLKMENPPSLYDAKFVYFSLVVINWNKQEVNEYYGPRLCHFYRHFIVMTCNLDIISPEEALRFVSSNGNFTIQAYINEFSEDSYKEN